MPGADCLRSIRIGHERRQLLGTGEAATGIFDFGMNGTTPDMVVGYQVTSHIDMLASYASGFPLAGANFTSAANDPTNDSIASDVQALSTGVLHQMVFTFDESSTTVAL